MRNNHYFLKLKTLVEQEMEKATNEETIQSLTNIMNEVNDYLSDTIYLIKVTNSGSGRRFLNIEKEDLLEYDPCMATQISNLEKAKVWEDKLTQLGHKTEIIEIKKENVEVGDEIWDYCNGFFGSDYGKKRVTEVGSNYITVYLENSGYEDTAYFEDGWQIECMPILIADWKGEI